MNLMFFLIPKSQVAYVYDSYTIRQVAEKLRYHHYTSIPILTDDGRYLNAISEGDLLWYIKDHGEMNFKSAENVSILSVPIERKVVAIHSNSDMETLFNLALNQNFVPVLDDSDVFIGIITRRSIINYFYKSRRKS